MKLLFTSVLVFLTSLFSVYAQDYYIDLSKKKFDILQRNYFISRVVDARANKQSIGFVQKDITNRRAYITFKNGLEKELQEFIGRNLPAQNQLQPVLMKVMRLQAKEYSNGGIQTATTELMVDFICEKNGQFFPIFRTSAIHRRNRIDVTAVHDENIVDALSDCLKQLAEINIDERLTKATAVSWEEVATTYNESEELLPFAILNDTILKRGFYKSVDEFRANTPSFTGNFEIHKRPRTARDWEGEFDVYPYFPMPDNKRKAVRNIWGFSDGETCYIKYHGEFYPLVPEGNNFTFYGHRPGNGVGVMVGQTTFGVVGAAIAYNVSNSNIKTKFLFTTQTGRITFYDQYLDAPLEQIADIKVVAYYLKDKSLNQNIKFELTNTSDTLTHTLAPNSFIELEWTLDRANPQLSACVTGDTSCYPFIPKMDAVTYIEIRRDAKSKQLVVEQVEAQKGEFYVKKLKGSQK